MQIKSSITVVTVERTGADSPPRPAAASAARFYRPAVLRDAGVGANVGRDGARRPALFVH